MIKQLIALMLLFSASCSAYEAQANFVTPGAFSIGGYDFLCDDRPFPVIKGQHYDVEEIDDVTLLPGESYQRLVQVSTLDGQSSHIFPTRIINVTKKATVVAVNVIHSRLYTDIADYGPSYAVHETSYDITLEDGSIMHIYHRNTAPIYGSNNAAKLSLLRRSIRVGDTIEFIAEEPNPVDFSQTKFVVKATSNYVYQWPDMEYYYPTLKYGYIESLNAGYLGSRITGVKRQE